MAVPSACVKMDIDSSKYSSFVPVIGVYVAGTSVVCFLAILYDIFSAIRCKKMWIPCKYFPLNSLTLTLLAVAAKLPVDLTSPMPSGLDQVSKLSGNALVCISMGFFAPSLGKKQKHDCLTNMLALSIFAVTLVVNTCVQIRTGVIFLFAPQHIIIMCCMLSMLCPLWMNAAVVAREDVHPVEQCRFVVRNGPPEGMLKRLQSVYVSSIATETNEMVYALSRNMENCSILALCVISLVSLMQPAVTNFSLEFCGGSSDYGKSVWVIVLVQILAVLAGTIAIAVRASGILIRLKISWRLPGMIPNLNKRNPAVWCLFLLMPVLACGTLFLRVLVCFPMGILLGLFPRKNQQGKNTDPASYNMKYWMKICDPGELYNPAANYAVWHASVILKKAQFRHANLSEILRTENGDQVSGLVSDALSVQRLIEISSALLPKNLLRDLLEAYEQVEVSFLLMSELAETQSIYTTQGQSLELYPPPPGRHFVSVTALRQDLEWCKKKHVVDIIDYIDSKYQSVMGNDSEKIILANLIMKMFCEMVKSIIREIPDHIYISVASENLSRLEFCHRLAISFEILGGIITSVEDCVDWVFPQNSHITHLITVC